MYNLLNVSGLWDKQSVKPGKSPGFQTAFPCLPFNLSNQAHNTTHALQNQTLLEFMMKYHTATEGKAKEPVLVCRLVPSHDTRLDSIQFFLSLYYIPIFMASNNSCQYILSVMVENHKRTFEICRHNSCPCRFELDRLMKAGEGRWGETERLFAFVRGLHIADSIKQPYQWSYRTEPWEKKRR